MTPLQTPRCSTHPATLRPAVTAAFTPVRHGPHRRGREKISASLLPARGEGWNELATRAAADAYLKVFSGIEPAARAAHVAARHLDASFFAGGELLPNVSYGPHAAHRLDIWRPVVPNTTGFPVVLYIHGGAFSCLSRKSHWMMAPPWVQHGYMVLLVDYRLAGQQPFPAALEDVCLSAQWLLDCIGAFGGRPDDVILAGDSSGANLAVTLGLLSAIERQEPYAQRLFAKAFAPRAVIGCCGAYGLTQPVDVGLVRAINDRYLAQARRINLDLTLSDPLRWLASSPQASRPVPSFFLSSCSNDFTVHESRKLHEALRLAKTDVTYREYDGGFHVFPMAWRTPVTQRFWQDTLNFCQKVRT